MVGVGVYVNGKKWPSIFQVANMIFLDAPVGSGFSYAKNWEGYNISDTSSVAEIYEFLRKVIQNYILITLLNLVKLEL